MSYADGRRILDADSHVMELPGFLDRFIEPEYVDRLHGREMKELEPFMAEATARAEVRRSDPSERATAEERLLLDKAWSAVGAFDADERSRVLDLFAFDGQWVFGTFAGLLYAGKDVDLLYAGSAAQNRAMAEFCAGDPRLLSVAFVPLVDPDRAVALAGEAIDLGCSAIHVPSTAAGERSPTHPDLDGFWELLNDAKVPFLLHVGGGGRLIDPRFHNNAMPVPDLHGGGENIRSKDFLNIAHSPATFLGVLILDGLFDRFRDLRGGCIEQGAGWVVSWLRHLDHAAQMFRRTEEPLGRLQAAPSDYVRKHLKFTPFPGEDVGWMTEQVGDELLMFSTDFPHPEGGRDPLAKFEATMDALTPSERDRFYYSNMADLLGARTPESAVA